jgi:predicted DNA-binding transcriptional regulator AlpA
VSRRARGFFLANGQNQACRELQCKLRWPHACAFCKPGQRTMEVPLARKAAETPPATRLIRRAELRRQVPYSDVHIWRLEHQDPPGFPLRIRLGANSVAWNQSEVDEWVASRIRAGGTAPVSRRRPTDAAD